MPHLTPWIPAIAPALLLAAALAAWLAPAAGRRTALLASLACALGFVLLAACSVALATGASFRTTSLAGFGPGFRLDALAGIMALLVSFIGAVVLAYSRNALDGDPGQSRFIGWLCATLACVLVVILAAGLVQLVLGWVGTSLCLHRLLLFHGERTGARRAAHKKFLTSRLSDACLAAAAILLAGAFGTADLSEIAGKAQALAAGGSVPASVHLAAVLLVGAAMTKSAQLPFHGWLPQAMETPTPVSALLHAGLINGGGFLLLRLADVMVLSPHVMQGLAMAGGLTALVGSSVMLTQTSIKGSLAWSTIAQMGFMMLQCGLGAFSAAMLHIVAHSLYKAHAFLGSADMAARSRAVVSAGPQRAPRAAVLIPAVAGAALLALAVGTLVGSSLSARPGAIALAAVMAMGLAQYVATTGRGAGAVVVAQSLGIAAALAALYIALQGVARHVLAGSLPPEAPAAMPGDVAIAMLVVLSFGLLAIRPALMPVLARMPGWRGLQVHLANGFYLDTLADRVLRRSSTSARQEA